MNRLRAYVAASLVAALLFSVTPATSFAATSSDAASHAKAAESARQSEDSVRALEADLSALTGDA